jgi:hypothetical protein
MPLPAVSRGSLAAFLLVTLLFILPLSAHATQYFSLGAGDFDILHASSDAVDFTGEWRGNPFFNHFLPVIGLEMNTEAGKYGFAGFNYDWEFMPNWILTPSAVAGVWSRGESTHLGGPFEFREGLELDYRLADGIRVGGRFTHMSNADIYEHNPGAETLSAIVSIPFGN